MALVLSCSVLSQASLATALAHPDAWALAAPVALWRKFSEVPEGVTDPFNDSNSINFVPPNCHGPLAASAGILLVWSLHLLRQALANVFRVTPSFFLLFALAAWGLCGARLAPLWRLSAPLPWLALGRALGCSAICGALGAASGAKRGECAPLALLTGVQWLLLGASSVATDQALHYGLFLCGAVCGLVAQRSLEALLPRRATSPAVVDRLVMVLALNWSMSLTTTGLWFLTETLGAAGLHVGFLRMSACKYLSLNCALDLLWVVGCGHLLLKKEKQELLKEMSA
ncbi:unnamed protein product [Effrenium voratum]|nr:unnamed protein product [Effrenium voratum]